jgi:integrase
MELEPIEPQMAVELYLTDREAEVRPATLKGHRSRLNKFVEWCEKEEIYNLNGLTGRQLHRFRIWRRNDGNLAPPSEKTQMDTLRVFIRWLGTIDGVDPDLHHKVRSPAYNRGEHAREVMIDDERAQELLAYLEKFEYATKKHVVMALLWHTMLRRGAVAALDLEDYDREERFLSIVHRPETDTPIKNGKRGQRLVALSSDVCMLLDDYILANRNEITDDYGRKPLVTTTEGRIAPSTITKYAYATTRPCEYGQDCPHGEDPEDCDAAGYSDSASRCPSSVSPHAFRRGGITHYLASDVPETAVSQRANVSSDVLERHYDQRSANDKMDQRRGYVDDM